MTLPAVSRRPARALSFIVLAMLAACDKAPDSPAARASPPPVSTPAPAAVQAPAPAPAPVAAQAPRAVYADYQPPLEQPEPIAVPWAPPPMRAEYPPPAPSPGAYWTGGYWVWQEGWAWAPGRWAVPPRPRYHWVAPYYEHRQDRVVFVNGFWAAPGVRFRPPAAGLVLALAAVGAIAERGHPPEGPQGAFLPPPPGSRPGLVVPAPAGTSPVVMTRAPAIMSPGMRVSSVGNVQVNNTTIINNVTIQAPAEATADHRPVNVTVPAHAHFAQAEAPGRSQTQAHGGPAQGLPQALSDRPAPAPAPVMPAQFAKPPSMPHTAAPQAPMAAPRGQSHTGPARPQAEASAPRPAPARPAEGPHLQAAALPPHPDQHPPRPKVAPTPEAPRPAAPSHLPEVPRPVPAAAVERPRPPVPARPAGSAHEEVHKAHEAH